MKNMINYDDISDNEIRILGFGVQPDFRAEGNKLDENDNNPDDNKIKPPRRRWIKISIIILILIITGIIAYFLGSNNSEESRTLEFVDNPANAVPSHVSLKKSTSSAMAYTDVADTIINDIPLKIFCPQGGHIELLMGKLRPDDKQVVLAAQAADLRADNGLPTGAFVYQGNLISKGHAKYGFCSIIGNDVTIGREIETPLFEKAVENNGSFFRQYALVSAGKVISIPPKGKAIRTALCMKNSKLIVVTTSDRESYHDFSQALADYGVKEALSLVGGDGIIKGRMKDGSTCELGKPLSEQREYENYIVWKK